MIVGCETLPNLWQNSNSDHAKWCHSNHSSANHCLLSRHWLLHALISQLSFLFLFVSVGICSVTNIWKPASPKSTTPIMQQEQLDGCFPRINGGMMQRDTQRFVGKLVSLVGKVTAPNTLQTADGTMVNIDVDQMTDTTLMIVNPDLVIEIMGMVTDATTFAVSVIYRLCPIELLSCGDATKPCYGMRLLNHLFLSCIFRNPNRPLCVGNCPRIWIWIYTIDWFKWCNCPNSPLTFVPAWLAWDILLQQNKLDWMVSETNGCLSGTLELSSKIYPSGSPPWLHETLLTITYMGTNPVETFLIRIGIATPKSTIIKILWSLSITPVSSVCWFIIVSPMPLVLAWPASYRN